MNLFSEARARHRDVRADFWLPGWIAGPGCVHEACQGHQEGIDSWLLLVLSTASSHFLREYPAISINQSPRRYLAVAFFLSTGSPISLGCVSSLHSCGNRGKFYKYTCYSSGKSAFGFFFFFFPTLGIADLGGIETRNDRNPL